MSNEEKKQKEKDPFTRFPNKVLDYILSTDFTATQLKIVLAICRNTYGWGEREYCNLSISALSKLVGKSERQIVRDMKILTENSILIEMMEGNKRFLKFNQSIINSD